MGCLLYALGDDQWDIPALRLLETIIPEHTAIDGFEVHHDFSGIGRRNMPLNARNVLYGASMAVSARSSSRPWSQAIGCDLTGPVRRRERERELVDPASFATVA
ncbi:hypothetical protein [Caulobacter sp. DWR1-3-2b1]|uniref:hypothetical protein n=1 Tax=Caulobacter sp. DWR1-3-2b1 TaxID=2804670 RepID=UPI003CF59BB0